MKRGLLEIKKLKVLMDEKECFICLKGGGLMKQHKETWVHGFCAIMHGNFKNIKKVKRYKLTT